MYTVELTRNGKVQQGWTSVTHWQVTNVESDSQAAVSEHQLPGIRVELCKADRTSVTVHLPTDGDSLWFMDPSTGETARSIQYEKYVNSDTGNGSDKVMRTGTGAAA